MLVQGYQLVMTLVESKCWCSGVNSCCCWIAGFPFTGVKDVCKHAALLPLLPLPAPNHAFSLLEGLYGESSLFNRMTRVGYEVLFGGNRGLSQVEPASVIPEPGSNNIFSYS